MSEDGQGACCETCAHGGTCAAEAETGALILRRFEALAGPVGATPISSAEPEPVDPVTGLPFVLYQLLESALMAEGQQRSQGADDETAEIAAFIALQNAGIDISDEVRGVYGVYREGRIAFERVIKALSHHPYGPTDTDPMDGVQRIFGDLDGAEAQQFLILAEVYMAVAEDCGGPPFDCIDDYGGPRSLMGALVVEIARAGIELEVFLIPEPPEEIEESQEAPPEEDFYPRHVPGQDEPPQAPPNRSRPGIFEVVGRLKDVYGDRLTPGTTRPREEPPVFQPPPRPEVEPENVVEEEVEEAFEDEVQPPPPRLPSAPSTRHQLAVNMPVMQGSTAIRKTTASPTKHKVHLFGDKVLSLTITTTEWQAMEMAWQQEVQSSIGREPGSGVVARATAVRLRRMLARTRKILEGRRASLSLASMGVYHHGRVRYERFSRAFALAPERSQPTGAELLIATGNPGSPRSATYDGTVYHLDGRGRWGFDGRRFKVAAVGSAGHFYVRQIEADIYRVWRSVMRREMALTGPVPPAVAADETIHSRFHVIAPPPPIAHAVRSSNPTAALSFNPARSALEGLGKALGLGSKKVSSPRFNGARTPRFASISAPLLQMKPTSTRALSSIGPAGATTRDAMLRSALTGPEYATLAGDPRGALTGGDSGAVARTHEVLQARAARTGAQRDRLVLRAFEQGARALYGKFEPVEQIHFEEGDPERDARLVEGLSDAQLDLLEEYGLEVLRNGDDGDMAQVLAVYKEAALELGRRCLLGDCSACSEAEHLAYLIAAFSKGIDLVAQDPIAVFGMAMTLDADGGAVEHFVESLDVEEEAESKDGLWGWVMDVFASISPFSSPEPVKVPVSAELGESEDEAMALAEAALWGTAGVTIFGILVTGLVLMARETLPAAQTVAKEIFAFNNNALEAVPEIIETLFPIKTGVAGLLD